MLRRAIVESNPGRGLPLRYSTSWNLQFGRVLPLKSEKLTFAIAPRLILGGGQVVRVRVLHDLEPGRQGAGRGRRRASARVGHRHQGASGPSSVRLNMGSALSVFKQSLRNKENAHLRENACYGKPNLARSERGLVD